MFPSPIYNPFAPSAPYYQQPAPQTMQGANTLPAQQVLQASGKASIDAIRMAPNSSALVMDTTAPLVWLCTSDSLGNVTSVSYDITPHKDAPPVDVAGLEARIAEIEKRMEELNHADQSNARNARAGKDGRNAPAD